jgi:hypothetical protein
LTQIVFLAVSAGAMLLFSTCTKDNDLSGDVNSSHTVFKSGSGPSANGLGIYSNNWGGTSHIRFHAITMPDGTAQDDGELKHFHSPDDYYLKYDIDCLTVNGNEAVMRGYVTESTFPLVPVGARVLVRAIDNGNGQSDPDHYTGVWYEGAPGWSDEWDCNNFPEQDLFMIELGNLVVNP